MLIEKKAWPEYFEKVLSGEKTFDLRLADFDCAEGDELILKEWDPITKGYTGREVRKRVGFVLGFSADNDPFNSEKDVKRFGYQIISLLD